MNRANRLNVLVMVAAFTIARFASSQQPIPPHKILTPEQQHFQSEIANWISQCSVLRDKAQAALDSEIAREKIGDCPNAASTRAAEECLTTEMEKTQANYTAFANSLRTMLGLAYPTMPGDQPASGPTGMPLTPTERVAEFDQLEAQSKHFRDDGVRAAYNQYKGGTLAPVFAAEAGQRLLRLHLQEFAFIYGEELSNH
jgi:hypothetical protein